MLILEQCINAQHALPFSGGYKAYPDRVPLNFSENLRLHKKIETDQIGDYVFINRESEEIIAFTLLNKKLF